MIRVLVDGIIFRKDPRGGIARLYREIWPRMCALEPEMTIRVFVDGPGELDLPPHAQIVVQKAPAVKRSIKTGGFMKQVYDPFRHAASRTWNYVRSLWLGRGAGMIWHSTYYTWPEFWDGRQVVTVHDMIHERFPDLYNDRLDEIARQHKRRCVEQADAIICVSDSTRQDLERFYDGIVKPVYVIPSALSEVFQAYHMKDSANSDVPEVPYILYVGKRTHHKNFRTLLDAYRQWENRDRFCIVAVGEPWERSEMLFLERMGITERVQLIDRIKDEALCRLYQRAAAFVFPSLYEGMGLPVLEAMACGCPVAASRIPTTVFTAGDVPFYFDPLDPGALNAALDNALAYGREPGRVQEGIQHAARFTWDRTAQATLDVYRSLDHVDSSKMLK